MDIIIIIVQLIIGLGILNVWFLRFGKSSEWRGGNATNMKEEFAVYGLPDGTMYVVGFLKVLFSLMLIAGIWLPLLVLPGAAGLGLLMLVAVAMHVKVGDAAKKSLPAGTLLLLCALLVILSI